MKPCFILGRIRKYECFLSNRIRIIEFTNRDFSKNLGCPLVPPLPKNN